VFIPEITKSHLGTTTLVNTDHPTEQAGIIASSSSLYCIYTALDIIVLCYIHLFSTVLTKVNSMVFIGQTQLFILYLMYYLGNMFRLTTELSSGPCFGLPVLLRSRK
jgi:hypothetical protein